MKWKITLTTLDTSEKISNDYDTYLPAEYVAVKVKGIDAFKYNLEPIRSTRIEKKGFLFSDIISDESLPEELTLIHVIIHIANDEPIIFEINKVITKSDLKSVLLEFEPLQ